MTSSGIVYPDAEMQGETVGLACDDLCRSGQGDEAEGRGDRDRSDHAVSS